MTPVYNQSTRVLPQLSERFNGLRNPIWNFPTDVFDDTLRNGITLSFDLPIDCNVSWSPLSQQHFRNDEEQRDHPLDPWDRPHANPGRCRKQIVRVNDNIESCSTIWTLTRMTRRTVHNTETCQHRQLHSLGCIISTLMQRESMQSKTGYITRVQDCKIPINNPLYWSTKYYTLFSVYITTITDLLEKANNSKWAPIKRLSPSSCPFLWMRRAHPKRIVALNPHWRDAAFHKQTCCRSNSSQKWRERSQHNVHEHDNDLLDLQI